MGDVGLMWFRGGFGDWLVGLCECLYKGNNHILSTVKHTFTIQINARTIVTRLNIAI